MVAKVKNSPDNADNGAEVGFVGSTEADNFATNTILLGGEGEAGEGGPRSEASIAVFRSSLCRPAKIWTSAKRKGVVSEFVPVYSPGCRRKKKTITIISAMARLAERLVSNAAASTGE
jgi:hypothetical protein